MLKGNNLILSINGTRLAASRTCGIDRQVDTVEVCSPVDGPAKKYIPSTTGWSISAGGLYANAAGAERLRSIWRKSQNGRVVTTLTIQVATDAQTVEQGEAILTDLNEQGDINSLVKFSIQLKGAGPLRLVTNVPTLSGLHDRQLVFGSDYVYYADEPGITVMYTDMSIIAGSTVRINCDGAPTRWVLCKGLYTDYEHYIDDNHEIPSSQYIARGESDAMVDVNHGGPYCILSDDSSQEPIVSILE